MVRAGEVRESVIERWWSSLDRPGWRSFAIAMLALAVALGLALYSAAAAETGHIYFAGACALLSLGLAAWVALTIVPVLARRTPLRWLVYHIHYKFTREGVIYVGGVFFIALAAMNTGNNLLFMILASMLAGIIVSGILSSISLSGVELKLELPEHIFAEQPVMAVCELRNEKTSLPSFSLRVSGQGKKPPRHRGRRENNESKKINEEILSRPVYFPYLPAQPRAPGGVRQQVELEFPRRGAYRQDAFGIVTRFPFGFLQKTREVESPMEIIVYPRVAPTEEFYEVLPLLSGELESFYRGRGHDLYSIRDYQTTDCARYVDWKASAKTSALKVREFTREDERRVLLVLDPYLPAGDAALEEKFERAVTLAACLAWHFYEIDSELQFRTAGFASPMAPAGEVIYSALRELALIEPQRAVGDGTFLAQLADATDVFKIILTSQPRGSIPTALWTSSYFVFLESL